MFDGNLRCEDMKMVKGTVVESGDSSALET